jgi:hypothetical protein
MTFEVHSFTNQKFSLERLYLAMSRCLKNPLVWLKRVSPAGTCWSSGNSLVRLELVGPAGTCWSSKLVGPAGTCWSSKLGVWQNTSSGWTL